MYTFNKVPHSYAFDACRVDTETRMEEFFRSFLATLKKMPRDEFADYIHVRFRCCGHNFFLCLKGFSR